MVYISSINCNCPCKWLQRLSNTISMYLAIWPVMILYFSRHLVWVNDSRRAPGSGSSKPLRVIAFSPRSAPATDFSQLFSVFLLILQVLTWLRPHKSRLLLSTHMIPCYDQDLFDALSRAVESFPCTNPCAHLLPRGSRNSITCLMAIWKTAVLWG